MVLWALWLLLWAETSAQSDVSRWSELVAYCASAEPVTAQADDSCALLQRGRTWIDGSDNDGAVMQVTDGPGRLGNNLGFIVRGLVFAKLSNYTAVSLVLQKKYLQEIFGRKVRLPLRSSRLQGAHWCPMTMLPRAQVYNFEGERCQGTSAQDCRTLAVETLHEAFSPKFRTCLDSVADDAEEELTIHLRGEDLWGLQEDQVTSNEPLSLQANAHHWLWHQPPCTLYRKIIEEEGFKKVRIVTSPDLRHTCVGWMKANAAQMGVKVLVQAGSLLEDFCTLAKASNLVLSYSSLSDNAALLNKRLRKLYFREFADKHSLLDCKLWPGTSLYQYSMPIREGHHEPYGSTYREVIRWFTSYDESQITRHEGCRS
ncbi:unnamed protein product [Symbiodinium microadriaticum]|nr:unnamed protein product [Symbiodinium microadriaticum]CAE7944337.1 unnamed protein product [Symbiodinium sp. KB8]